MSALLPIYRTVTALGEPVISWYLRRRLARGKEDAGRFNERLGIARQPRPQAQLIWMHGASVGEALSLLPLMTRIIETNADVFILLTTGTVTSARLIKDRLPERTLHQFVPVDRQAYVSRFLDHWKPDLVLWSESDFWPNLVTLPAERAIPMILINGRISPQSFKSWRRWPGLIRKMLSGFSLCLAQAKQDGERLAALGAGSVRCVGNLKFAVPPLPADDVDLAALSNETGTRPRWLAASTHPGEEPLIWQSHQELKKTHADILTFIVPRHADRGATVADELRAAGANVARRGADQPITLETDIYLADTMGELGLFFRLSDIVFMGKSLVDQGGQNPLEPARLGSAILFGPHMWNFPDITERMIAAGIAETIADPISLANAVQQRLNDPAALQDQAARARTFAEAEAGVLDAVLAEISPFIEQISPRGSPQ